MEDLKTLALIQAYLDKSSYPEYQPIKKNHKEYGLIIVIPSFEEPKLKESLLSLASCSPPDDSVLVIVVVNQSEEQGKDLSPENQINWDQTINIQDSFPSWLDLKGIKAILPKKLAGVGLARKIGMDHALEFHLLNKKPKAPIVCFDADCLVETSYLKSLEEHFNRFSNSPAASIRFEHPLDSENSEEIALYELRLRVYIQGLRWAGYPYAFHTIGSSMAVRAVDYARIGGMNKLKAGEDFYFLHKLFPLQNFSEIQNTCVYPSPRESERVPFGTGRAMLNHAEGLDDLESYFPIESYSILRENLDALRSVCQSDGPESARNLNSRIHPLLLETIKFNQEELIKDLHINSKTVESRLKRLFFHLSGIRILQFFHALRDSDSKKDTSLIESANWLLEKCGIKKSEYSSHNTNDVLEKFRELQSRPWTPD